MRPLDEFDRANAHVFARESLRSESIGHEIIACLEEWEGLILWTVEICTARFAKQVFKKLLIKLVLLLVLGLVLHEARGVFFYVAPHIIKHSHTWTVVANAIMIDFIASIDAIKLITFAVEEALHFLSAGKFPHNMPHLTSMLEPRLLNASSLRQALKESTVPCSELHTGWKTLQTWFRSRTSPQVCPVLRSVTPLGQPGRFLNFVGSPFSFGASPQGNNCNEGDYDVAQSAVCMIVNSGLVVLEVVLPLVIVTVLIRSYLGVAVKGIWLTIKSTVLALRCAILFVGAVL
jgi:hypothetical protein